MNKIGIVINYSASEFYDAVIWFKNNLEEAIAMGNRGRLLYEENYRWSIMEQKLIDSLRAI